MFEDGVYKIDSMDIFDGNFRGQFSSCPEELHLELADGDVSILKAVND